MVLVNANISLALPVNGICQYPFKRSNLLMYTALPMQSMQSSIIGIGQVSDFVALLTFLKSVRNLKDLSGFGTKILGENLGPCDFSMILFSNMYFTS